MVFPTRNDHFGVLWGYHHLRKHPINWLEHLSHSNCWQGDCWQGPNGRHRVSACAMPSKTTACGCGCAEHWTSCLVHGSFFLWSIHFFSKVGAPCCVFGHCSRFRPQHSAWDMFVWFFCMLTAKINMAQPPPNTIFLHFLVFSSVIQGFPGINVLMMLVAFHGSARVSLVILLARFQGLVHTSFMEEQSLYHLPSVLGCLSVNGAGATYRLLGFLKHLVNLVACVSRGSRLDRRQKSAEVATKRHQCCSNQSTKNWWHNLAKTHHARVRIDGGHSGSILCTTCRFEGLPNVLCLCVVQFWVRFGMSCHGCVTLLICIFFSPMHLCFNIVGSGNRQGSYLLTSILLPQKQHVFSTKMILETPTNWAKTWLQSPQKETMDMSKTIGLAGFSCLPKWI